MSFACRFGFQKAHAANGYLLNPFITNYANLRTDKYGGSVEGGIRTVVEIIKAIQAVVGPDYPVGVRIPQEKVNDVYHRWPGGEKDAEIIFTRPKNAYGEIYPRDLCARSITL